MPDGLAGQLTDLEMLSMIIGAAVHDVGHPGKHSDPACAALLGPVWLSSHPVATNCLPADTTAGRWKDKRLLLNASFCRSRPLSTAPVANLCSAPVQACGMTS